MTGGYYCDHFLFHGRHDFRWQESTAKYEIWECADCGKEMHDERQDIEPKAKA